jgi:hypothetical protein
MWGVVRTWMVPVGVGVVAGIGVGAALARAIAGMIGVVSRPDLTLPMMLPLVLGLSSGVACYIPIRRTVRGVALTDAIRTD